MNASHDAGPRRPPCPRLRRAKAGRVGTPGRAFFAVAAVLLPALMGWRLSACSTPVCQYALENWPADAYDVVIAANRPVDAALRAGCEEALGGSGTAVANAALRFLEEASLPTAEVRLSVRFPDHPAGRAPIWTGPLSTERLQWVLDSPVRARLVDELVRGAAAVFLFLPAGATDADTAARARLQAALAEMVRTLALPPPDTDAASPSPPLRFPILEVPPQDPAEGFLRAMLLASEPDLADLHEPMTFPVFGRGRALYAVVGAGINRDVLTETCVFLTGACSCQVKAQNPGVDLLLRADWDRAMGSSTGSFEELPPLAALPAPAEAAPTAAAPPPAAPPIASATPGGPLYARRALLVAAAALAAVLAGTLILLARTRSR